MSDDSRRDPAFPLPHILQPGEILEAHATVQDAIIAVTNHRVIVAEGDRTVLDIPFSGLRRIQFDIERGRVAPMVILPEHPRDEPVSSASRGQGCAMLRAPLRSSPRG